MTAAALEESYRDRRVLVTGASGFKGSWLVRWLGRLGARVHGLGLAPPEGASLFAAGRLDRDIDWTALDVRDARALAARVAAARPDTVFHLAAEAQVRPAYRDPLGTLATNALGTAHLLEALRAAGRPTAVVVVTSDKCYAGGGPGRPLVEGDPLGGSDPYSASKACAEIVSAAWRDSYFPEEELARHGVVVATARAGNVLGPGDYAAERLVPSCIRDLEAGRPVALRRPRAVRPWQHVLEPLLGYLRLGALADPRRPPAERRAASGAWNFGPPAAAPRRPVSEVAELLIAAWGGGRWVPAARPDDPPETERLELDAGRAERRLGWRSVWALEETLERTARGYRRLRGAAPAEVRALLDRELEAFGEAAADAARERAA